MFSDREVLSTLEMLKNENLDVRTITLGISLLECINGDPNRFAEQVRSKIESLARDLVRVCDDVGDKYGIPVVNKRVSVSPIAVAAAPFSTEEMVALAKTLDETAR